MTIKRQFIAVMLILIMIGAVLAAVYYSSNVVSAEEANEGITITVVNEMNDYSFEIEAKSLITSYNGGYGYEIRVYSVDITNKIHYFQIAGYDFAGFNNDWLEYKKGDSIEYYYKKVGSRKELTITARYLPKNVSIKFYDSLTGEEISSSNVSYGGAVVPPTAPNHLIEGYVFVGWTGGSYEECFNNCVLYADYAPARYVTIKLPNDTEKILTVAKGSKYSDIQLDVIGNKIFKYFVSVSGAKIDKDSVIEYDTVVVAKYGLKPMADWLKAIVISLSVIIGIVIISLIAKSIRRRF